MHDGYVYETGVPYPYDFEAPCQTPSSAARPAPKDYAYEVD